MIVLICTEVFVGNKSSTGKETNQRYTGQYESCSDYTINIHILKKKYEHNTTRPRVIILCSSEFVTLILVTVTTINSTIKGTKPTRRESPKVGGVVGAGVSGAQDG